VAADLFVGTRADATDEQHLETQGITTVISLIHENLDLSEPAIDIHAIPLIDGPQNSRDRFTEAVTETVTALADNECVLVHCAAGASRSPTVAATALALYQDIELGDAIQQVADNRADVDPHEALLRQAAHVYTERADSASSISR
jgi:protein-tyrosine phosphatase